MNVGKVLEREWSVEMGSGVLSWIMEKYVGRLTMMTRGCSTN